MDNLNFIADWERHQEWRFIIEEQFDIKINDFPHIKQEKLLQEILNFNFGK